MVYKLHRSHLIRLAGIIFVVVINLLTHLLVELTNIPLFLDTWGTSLGVIVVGLWTGIIGGVIYNIVMALSQGWSLIWMISSIWIAFTTWFLYKRGLINIRRPKALLFSGLFLGFTNALVTFEITTLMFGGMATYQPTNFIHQFFSDVTGSLGVGAFLHHLVVELIDKTVSLFIAAWVAFILPVKIFRKGFVKKAFPSRKKAKKKRPKKKS